MQFESVAPILRVQQIARSLDYYVRVLGFTIDWQIEARFASVSRDECVVFLSVGDQGRPGAWVWIGVSDVETLHSEYVAVGAKVRHPPTNYSWALEMQIEDPDGNVLRMGSEAKPDEPFGEWLDMDGKKWPLR